MPPIEQPGTSPSHHARVEHRRLDNLRQDVGYAIRALRQSRGFAATVVLILALGIGANTAIFTIIDALVLRSLPVPHPEQLVAVGDPKRTGGLSQGTPRTDLVSYPLYVDVRDQNHVVSGLYATGRAGRRLDVIVSRAVSSATAPGGRGGAEMEHPRGRFVSGNFFAVLQVPAAAGRTFTADEDRVPGGDPVIVLSYDYWQRRFGGERSVVGRTIAINGTPMTVVGVAARGFSGDIVGQPTEIWIPIMMQPALMPHSPWLTDRNTSWLLLMGRLAPGVTLAQARTALTTLEARSIVDHASAADRRAIENGLRQQPIQVGPGARGFSYYRSIYTRALFTLMAAVALVLLVVTANIANLLLARAVARGREMSVRMALGASRLRLLQQLLTESVLLALAGGAAGLLIALWGSAALLRVASSGPTPIPIDARLDGRVLIFTAALALSAAVLFGLVPALRATRVELASALRAQGRGLTGPAGGAAGRWGVGRLLVVVQVALSALLLVGTGMLVRSTQRLESVDLGLARDQLVIATLDAGSAGYEGPRLLALMRDLLERVGRVRGVAAVTLSENGLFSGTESATTLQAEGFTAHADADTDVAYDVVGPRYFHTIGAHLLRGRDVEARDGETAPKVAVVNSAMARFFFPRGDALGRHLTVDSATYEIVGVVADVYEHDVREPPERRVYFPAAQQRRPPSGFRFEVRTTGDPARLVVPVRRALLAADPSLAVLDVDPLPDLVRDSIGQDRLVAQVVTFFGALALALAAIGLYGVMAYATARRTGEFGLRMALGARPGDVARLVLGEAMTLLAGGVTLGLPAALAAMRVLRHQLFGIGPLDPPSLAVAVAVLALSAALASYLPARRASRIPPLEALRTD